MGERSDEQLMQEYAAGDMSAFDLLYARYREPLYRYLRRQLPDMDTTNDLYQGLWEKIINARKRYRTNVPFRAWAFRIARNHLIDHFRRHARATGPDPAGLPAVTRDPGEDIDRQQRQQRLRAAIAALPPEQRDVLLLRLEAGLSLGEIATMAAVGRETIKSRLRYATARLKRVLQP